MLDPAILKCIVVRLGGVAPGFAGGDAEQLMRLEGRVRRVAAMRDALVVVRVSEAGHGEVELLSNAHSQKVRGDLEPRFEGAHTVPCHGMGAREGMHGGRYRVLEESLVPALLFQV